MTKRESQTKYYDCFSARGLVVINKEKVTLCDDVSGVPVASTISSLRCSGFSTCKVFPSDELPSIEGLSKPTECEYIDVLRMTGG